jgi:hypothetical protein
MTDRESPDRWGITPADDEWHPANDDPWWTETIWFAWHVPERKLIGYWYPVFRPNLGVQAGGVIIFDDTAELPWEILVHDYDWQRPIPPGIRLSDLSLDNGMTLRCLVPGRHYEFGYDGRDVQLTLHAETVTRPLVTRATPPFNNGHIDQLCHVTGQMVLYDDVIEVDCIAMRDRSWGPRQDGRQPQVGYDYGALDADNAFLAVSVGREGDYQITTGFYIRDGRWSQLTGGVRRAERDDQGRPTAFTIEARDAVGRSFQAQGTALSRQALISYPSMLCWNELVQWDLTDGWRGYGEDQDVWHPRRWRQHVAHLRAEAVPER